MPGEDWGIDCFDEGLNVVFDGNHYLVTGIIGVLSSIVDNVPLVAGCMGMYPWQPLVIWLWMASSGSCSPTVPEVGGSMLIIGSAAGVVVMGLRRLPSAGI